MGQPDPRNHIERVLSCRSTWTYTNIQHNVCYARSPVTTVHEVPDSAVKDWINAWNSHDTNRILELFADDALMYHPESTRPLTKDGIRGFFSILFHAYPDIHLKSLGELVQGNEVASWELVTGKMTESFREPEPGQVIEPTGKSFEIHAAVHLVYDEENKLKHVRIYWNRLFFTKQPSVTP
jgi:steroid delta-isomerase-like uncharacterized protein